MHATRHLHVAWHSSTFRVYLCKHQLRTCCLFGLFFYFKIALQFGQLFPGHRTGKLGGFFNQVIVATNVFRFKALLSDEAKNACAWNSTPSSSEYMVMMLASLKDFACSVV